MKRRYITEQELYIYNKLYSPEKKLIEVKKEVKEKGFSILEVSDQKRLEFLYNLPKKYLFIENPETKWFWVLWALFFLSMYIGVLYSPVIWTLWKITIWVFLIGLYYFIVYLVYKEKQRRLKSIDFSNMGWIYDKYICITKDYIFFNNDFIPYRLSDLDEKSEMYNRIFLAGEYVYEQDFRGEAKNIYALFRKWNFVANKVSKLKKSLALLEKYFEYIEKLQQKIRQEFEIIKKWDFYFTKATNYIERLQKTINNSIQEKNLSIKLLQSLNFKKYLNFELFDIYLKNKFSFSVVWMQWILKKHIFLIDYLKEKNTKFDSGYIQLADKRLSLYKKSLEQQIKELENYIL